MVVSLVKFKNMSFEAKLIYLCTVAAFLPYYVTVIAIAITAGIILFNKDLQKKAFSHRGVSLLCIFSVYSVLVAMSYGNVIGILCTILFFALFVVGLLARAIMTKRLFERILHISSLMSIAVTGSLVFERLIFAFEPYYRCRSYFFNANYAATILAISVVICAYRVISKTGTKSFYYSVAICNAIGIYITGSMFAWVLVFIGVSLLLFLAHEHHLLSIFLLTVAVFGLIISLIPDLFPRISQIEITAMSRIEIWENAIKGLEDNYITGRGFLTYFQLYKNYSGVTIIAHCHNIILDTLLSHGIVGTVFLLGYFLCYYLKVNDIQKSMSKSSPVVLIVALTAAVIFH